MVTAEEMNPAAGSPCPGCQYVITWHATHCCKKCAVNPGTHGWRCCRRTQSEDEAIYNSEQDESSDQEDEQVEMDQTEENGNETA